jgi:hypothetical protein
MKFIIKCDSCKATLRETDSLRESAEGGLCITCGGSICISCGRDVRKIHRDYRGKMQNGHMGHLEYGPVLVDEGR